MIRKPLAVLATAVGLVLGCAGARAAGPVIEFIVGVHSALTGPLARSGQPFEEGFQVAARYFNEGQSKYKVRLVSIDDQSNPATAVAAVEKLASEGAIAVLGGYGSNIIAPASDMANKLKLVYMTGGGASEELTRRGYKGFFRVTSNAGYRSAIMTLISELKPKSISIVYSTRESPSLLAKEVEKYLVEGGYTYTLHPFDPTISDFKPLINKIKLQDRPDMLVMMGYENDYIGILRAAKVLKPNLSTIAGLWSLATPKMGQDFPDLMENVIGTTVTPYPLQFKTVDGKRLTELYNVMYNKDLEYLAIFGFVEGMLLFETMAKVSDSGPLTFETLSAALHKIDRETLIGPVAFDQVGENYAVRLTMGQHQKGKIVLVSPRSAATGSIVVPGVPW